MWENPKEFPPGRGKINRRVERGKPDVKAELGERKRERENKQERKWAIRKHACDWTKKKETRG